MKDKLDENNMFQIGEQWHKVYKTDLTDDGKVYFLEPIESIMPVVLPFKGDNK